MVHDAAELDDAFAAMANDRHDGVIAQPSLPIERSAQLALQYHMPAACALHAFTDEGG